MNPWPRARASGSRPRPPLVLRGLRPAGPRMIPGAGELHHVGVVVSSIAESLPFYRDTLGMRAGPVRELVDQRVRATFLTGSNARIELIEPIDAESGVARFLAERGKPALHHVCFVVDDLRGALAARARGGGCLCDS